MKRTNTFTLNPGKEESAILNKWGNEYARMYNKINYKRWKACMPVECEPPYQLEGDKITFVDMPGGAGENKDEKQ